MAYQPITYGVASPVGTNSTVTNLAAGATFTGLAENVLAYSNIKINVNSSHISATDGLIFQQSDDGTTWLSSTDAYTIPANSLKSFSIAANMRFFRVLYTNGPTLTTSFLIHIIYHTNDKQPSSVRPQDGRGNDNDFVEVVSAMIGYNSAANTWDRLRTSITNGLQVDVTRMPTTAVTGTFFQATQPVSGAFFQATQPVSGVFFQATQPVSIAATVTADVTDRATRQLGIASVRGLAIAPQSTPFAAATTGTTAGFDILAAANVTFIIKNTVAATAWTGTPVIVFEQSDDNVSWALLLVVRNDTSLSASTHTLPVNTANTEYMFDTAVEGVSFVRARITTGTTTGGITIGVQPGSLPFSPSVTAILNPETTKVIGTVNVAASNPLFIGKTTTYRTVGRAGTTGQVLLTLYNASGSPVTITVNKIFIGYTCTAVKAITVITPVMRVYKLITGPTNGTNSGIGKTKVGGTSTSNANVTVLSDSSSDGVNAATALGAALGAGFCIAQAYAPRLITAAGFESNNTLELLGSNAIVLNAVEGVAVTLDYTTAAQNPITDFWVSTIEWSER